MLTVTFCGHSDFNGEREVVDWLRNVVDDLIHRGADDFLLGGYGGFDVCAASVVWEMKQTYPHIRSTLVLPYLDRDVDAEKYDSTWYPPLEEVPKRFAIAKRNEYMVDAADVVVAYVKYDWGGAARTLDYARRKNKEIIRFGP